MGKLCGDIYDFVSVNIWLDAANLLKSNNGCRKRQQGNQISQPRHLSKHWRSCQQIHSTTKRGASLTCDSAGPSFHLRRRIRKRAAFSRGQCYHFRPSLGVLACSHGFETSGKGYITHYVPENELRLINSMQRRK
jgi:hypothetical protein